MKNSILSVFIFALFITGCSNNNDTDPIQNSCDFINFKYYDETQDYLGELSNDYILIGIDTTYSNNEIRNFISTVNHFDQGYEYIIHNSGQYKFKEIPVKL